MSLAPAATDQARASAARSPRMRRGAVAVVGALLGLATLCVYWPVRHHAFVAFDDAEYVATNAHVQAGLTWAGVKWAFTTGHAGNWHPLTWLSHMLDTELFGAGPGGPHAVNVLLHLGSTLLLFALLRRLTGACWRSALVAAFFAVHPLHVESVAWISERKDVLSGFFFLLTLWAYARYAEVAAGVPACQRESDGVGRQGRRPLPCVTWYLVAMLLFACGLMSKPMLVTLPCVLLLLDYWPLCRLRLGPALLEKLPFFLLSAVSCVVTFHVQRRGGAVESLEAISIWERVANALVSYARYLEKTFWPADLAIFYPHPRTWPLFNVVFAALLIVVVGAGIVRLRRAFPFVAVGWLWFFGMLVPTLGLVQVGLQSMADRYLYLPSIGVFIVIAWTGEHVARSWRVSPRIAAIAAGAVVTAGAVRASMQVRHWRDSETLFGHALAVTRGNYIAHHSLGHALREQGRVDEAIAHFRAALAIWPRFADAHNNLGEALLGKGDLPGAVAHFRQAAEARPGFALAHYNLGTTLLETGPIAAAIQSLETASALAPDDVLVQLNLGNARLQTGDPARALEHYRQVLWREPNHADALNNAGSALLQQGRVDDAIARFEHVLRVQPAHANAHFNLGDVFLRLGQFDRAVAHLERTVALAPDDGEARQVLAVASEQRAKARASIVGASRHE